jgi:hypothetical protein
VSFRAAAIVPVLVCTALPACGGSPLADDAGSSDLAIAGTLQPQSFVHGTLAGGRAQATYAFTGAAGAVIAPDVWPAAGAANLRPTLTLLSPRGTNGHRVSIAHGTPRGADPRHLAIDGFRLSQAGTYLMVIGQEAQSQGGAFSVRLWTSASHAPRPESAQLDLATMTSVETHNVVAAHAGNGALAPTPWTDADVAFVVSSYLAQADRLVALSDAHELALALAVARSEGLATDAQVSRSAAGAAQLVGTQASFGNDTRAAQAFALYWLGKMQAAVFTSQVVQPLNRTPPAQRVSNKIDALVASWSAAVEEPGRTIRAMQRDGVIYGYVVDWGADQRDTDGSPVFTWFSTDFFDASGRWLGESSQGATEAEDD